MQRHEFRIDDGCLTYWLRPGKTRRWAIFLHGGGAGHDSFAGQFDLFDEEWNLLFPDMRGVGQSKLDEGSNPDFDDIVEDIARIAERHGIRGAVILGHSFGAAVAQEVAHRHPRLAEKLVLMGAYNHHRAPGSGLMDGPRVALTKAILAIAPWPFLAGLFARMSTRDEILRTYLRNALVETGKKNWRALGLSAFRSMHAVERYEHPHPTLLIRGEREMPGFLDRIYTDMQKVNPETEIAVIPDAGHLAPQEKPAATNRAIARFLGLPDQPGWASGPREALQRLEMAR